MAVTRLKILKHVLKILDINKEGQKLLIGQGVDYVSKLIHNKNEIYQSPVEKQHSKFFLTNAYQLFIFKQ